MSKIHTAKTTPTAIASNPEREFMRLLLVEDDSDAIEVTVAQLARTPGVRYEVTVAGNLAEALRQVDLSRVGSTPFDVILLDLNLPDSQGPETFQRLRAHAPATPILIQTGAADQLGAIRAVNQGAQDFVVKASKQSSMVGSIVRLAVERHQLHRRSPSGEPEAMEPVGSDSPGTDSANDASKDPASSIPLLTKSPEQFQALIARYDIFLTVALEDAVHGGASSYAAGLTELAEELGLLNAGPRDVIDLHVHALRARMEKSGATKARAMMNEGRWIALELMGNLVAWYHNQLITARSNPS